MKSFLNLMWKLWSKASSLMAMELVSDEGRAIDSSSVESAAPTWLWDSQLGSEVELGQLEAHPRNSCSVKV